MVLWPGGLVGACCGNGPAKGLLTCGLVGIAPAVVQLAWLSWIEPMRNSACSAESRVTCAGERR